MMVVLQTRMGNTRGKANLKTKGIFDWGLLSPMCQSYIQVAMDSQKMSLQF